ncbi:MAG: TIGR00296 family protein [Candidatus Methanofastidiosa archaeon]|nr:TIGR00296 family protein [Candidatus Methanofastidiosa archaeon]
MGMVTAEEGSLLVANARSCIEHHLRGTPYEAPPGLPESFFEKSGVFVTLKTYPERQLRGCIGYPEPSLPLFEALCDAAVSAATRDPRFYPVTLPELEALVVEVTVLTPPVPVSGCQDLAKAVRVGRDGLIIEKGYHKGLLLPQVPVEWGWTEEEYLSQTCVKAGLSPDAWSTDGVTVFTFTGQVFSETRPQGETVEHTWT